MRSVRLMAASALTPLVFSGVAACGQSFTAILPAAGFQATLYRGAMSDDGRTIAGENLLGPVEESGFVWTASGGRNNFGLEPGLPPWTFTYGLSGDGTTVVGAGWTGRNNESRAFRYRGPGTYQSLGLFAGVVSTQAHDASVDGGVIVGWGLTSAQLPVAFRWTEAEGMQRIPFARAGDSNSTAEAVSGDGRVVVGTSSSFDSRAAFTWTTTEGTRILEEIGPWTGGTEALGVNSDGSLIVGMSGAEEGALWRNGRVQSLGKYSGMITRANALDADGSVILGNAVDALGALPIIWTDGAGPRSLMDYFGEHGIVLPTGWTPYGPTTVSADGLTFAGTCLTADGGAFAYVATVPSPGVATVFLVASLAPGCRRKRPHGIASLE